MRSRGSQHGGQNASGTLLWSEAGRRRAQERLRWRRHRSRSDFCSASCAFFSPWLNSGWSPGGGPAEGRGSRLLRGFQQQFRWFRFGGSAILGKPPGRPWWQVQVKQVYLLTCELDAVSEVKAKWRAVYTSQQTRHASARGHCGGSQFAMWKPPGRAHSRRASQRKQRWRGDMLWTFS